MSDKARKKELEARVFLTSMRGHYIVSQALYLGAKALAEKEPSNAADMKYLHDSLFPLFGAAAAATEEFQRRVALRCRECGGTMAEGKDLLEGPDGTFCKECLDLVACSPHGREEEDPEDHVPSGFCEKHGVELFHGNRCAECHPDGK